MKEDFNEDEDNFLKQKFGGNSNTGDCENCGHPYSSHLNAGKETGCIECDCRRYIKMELTQEDKDFLENKFGEKSIFEDVTDDDWIRFKEIKARHNKKLPQEKKATKPIRTPTPEQSTNGRYIHLCNRCGYEWMSSAEIPNNCAKCRSPFWNKPRERATKERNKALVFSKYKHPT